MKFHIFGWKFSPWQLAISYLNFLLELRGHFCLQVEPDPGLGDPLEVVHLDQPILLGLGLEVGLLAPLIARFGLEDLLKLLDGLLGRAVGRVLVLALVIAPNPPPVCEQDLCASPSRSAQ